MQKKLTKKEETRIRMLDAAGRSFRSHGYAGIGVDGIAKAAGVTSGALYAHFGPKDAAFSAALTKGLDEVIEGIPAFQHKYGGDWLKAFAEYYLGKAHRQNLDCGCAMSTLTPEVVRSKDQLHDEYEKKMSVIASLMAEGLASQSKIDCRERAWAVLGILIGGLNMARAMKNHRSAEEVANAVKIAVVKVAGRTKTKKE